MTYQLRMKEVLEEGAAVTLQMAESRSERPANTTHVKAGKNPRRATVCVVALRRKCEVIRREWALVERDKVADDKQAVEWKGSCKRSFANTDACFVSILYNGVP